MTNEEFDAKKANQEIERLQLELARQGNTDFFCSANPTFKITETALKTGIVYMQDYENNEYYATISEDILNNPKILAREVFAEPLGEPRPTAMDLVRAMPHPMYLKDDEVFAFFNFGGYYGYRPTGGERPETGWDWNTKDNIKFLEFSSVEHVIEYFS